MQLELSHSKRLGQTINTTWAEFHPRYLSGDTKHRIWIELNKTGKSKLTDEDGTLYVRVIK